MKDTLAALLHENGLRLEKILFSSPRSIVVEVIDKNHYVSVLKVRKSDSSHLSIEASILEELDHPNIVKMISLYLKKKISILHLEKVEGICLIDFLSENGPIEENIVQNISIQLIETLHYINSKNYYHLDLKPDNLIYDFEKNHLTLIDFETMIDLDEPKTKEIVGTQEYQSPEVKKGKYKGPEAQCWSLGLTIFCLLTNEFPKWVNIGHTFIPFKKHRLLFPENINLSEECHTFLTGLLNTDSKKRTKMCDLDHFDWIKNIINTKNFFFELS